MSIKSIDQKFTSANSVPVERAAVTWEEWEAVKGITEELVKASKALLGSPHNQTAGLARLSHAVNQYEAAVAREAKQ